MSNVSLTGFQCDCVDLMELQLTLIIISPHSAIKNIESINRPIIMKSLLYNSTFYCNLSFAQDKVESNELSVKITLSDWSRL